MSTDSSSDYPIRLEVDLPERSSRGLALLGIIYFLKSLLLLPHLIIMFFLGIAQMFVVWIAYWAVLFTGKYPEGMLKFTVGVSRWQMRVNGWFFGWTDRYPPFGLN